MPRKRGQPRKLTEEKIDAVIAFVTAGGSRLKAADYVGVAVSTIQHEAERNPEFLDRLTRAESSCYMKHLNNVSQAGAADWRASAFLLERKWPDEFGRKDRLDVHKIDNEIERELARITARGEGQISPAVAEDPDAESAGEGQGGPVVPPTAD